METKKLFTSFILVYTIKFMTTETSSFRLNKEPFAMLKNEAKKQNLSVNSLVNKIIKRYVEWGVFTPSIQYIPFPTTIIIATLKLLSEKQIRDIGREHAKKHAIENLLLLKNEVSVDAYLEVVKIFCEIAEFAYSLNEKNDSRAFMARHNQGAKFSILFSQIVISDFEELFGKKIDVKETANSISFSISGTYGKSSNPAGWS